MRRRQFAALTGASLVAAPALVRAQAGWKADKPITIYNPFAAGGGTDIHIRLMGETAGPKLGQPILVDAKPGAAGTLAPALLLNARPDGHTLACMSINSLRYPHYQPTTWHPLRDFTYIIGLSGYTIGIVCGLRQTNALFKPSNHVVSPKSSMFIRKFFGCHAHGHRKLSLVEVSGRWGKFKTARHHADDRVRLAIEADRGSDHVWLGVITV
jgi:hypothetical protein